jgi:hypothetical protein
MIKEAAIRKDGRVYTGHRHHNIINSTKERGLPFGYFRDGEQGFVTTTGEFVNRQEAARIALELGQVKRGEMRDPECLYSEDLY